MDVEIEDRTDGDERLDGVSADKMGKLFDEANAVKMLNLQRILSAQGKDDPERGSKATNHSQVALKAISIQLKILSEEFRRELGRGRSEKVNTIFEAMVDVPKMKALVSRDAIREQVLDNLKAMLDEEERVAAKAARTFSGGPAPGIGDGERGMEESSPGSVVRSPGVGNGARGTRDEGY